MKIHELDLNLYILFEAIFSEGYVSKAADKVGVSHVTGSKALMRLRACHNDELFVSTNKGMIPTPMAKSLIGPVRKALALIQQGMQDKGVFKPETAEYTFKVSASGSCEAVLSAELAAVIEQMAPGIQLRFGSTKRHLIGKELEQGKLDLALDIDFRCDQKINRQFLGRADYVVAVRRDHPVLREQWDLQQYLSLGHVVVSQRKLGVNLVDMELAKRKGVTRQVRLRAGYNVHVPSVLQQTNLAWTVTSSYPMLDQLVTLPLPLTMPELELYLYWHERQNNNAANLWLRQQILQARHAHLS